MPIFVDTHHIPELDSDTIAAFVNAAHDAVPYANRARPLDLYCGIDDRLFYVVAAPEEAAVREMHAAAGMTCWNIRQLDTDPRHGDELGEHERALIRHMIVAELDWAEVAS
jgi:hypothetical protein